MIRFRESSPRFNVLSVAAWQEVLTQMLLAQYGHRLPADYDVNSLRQRAEGRGLHWNQAPSLHFKAFILRQRGILGAAESEYGSVYLWRDVDGLRDLLATSRFEVVTAAFGRPAVDTRIVIDARRGGAEEARFARVSDIAVSTDADLARVIQADVEASRAMAADGGTHVSVVALDAARWRLKRVALVAEQPEVAPGEKLYRILHLSRSLLNGLPCA